MVRLSEHYYVVLKYIILIFRCVEGMENMRTSPEAIAGYSGALAAVLGGVRLSPLGVPHTKGKVLSKYILKQVSYVQLCFGFLHLLLLTSSDYSFPHHKCMLQGKQCCR